MFWHDVEGSFTQEFEQLRQEGIGGAGGRKVLFADASSESLFDLKRRILRENREDDFLVYTRSSRDFSEGGLEGNWLADIELISEHFQADKASMLLGEVNAGPDAPRRGGEVCEVLRGGGTACGIPQAHARDRDPLATLRLALSPRY